MELFDAMDVAGAQFRARLVAVGAQQWTAATPCEGWTVRDLVNHVLGGVVRYTMLLHGAAADEVNATRALDHIGADPVGSFDRTTAQMSAAFREPGALQRTVHHPAGDVPGERLLVMRVTEFALHGWDLARATGQDETLDAAVVEVLWSRLHPIRGEFSGTPAFAAPDRDDDETAPLQSRLLLLTGRRP